MSITHIVLLLLVVVLIFGTKKLRNIGSDLGGAMRDFKKGLDGDEEARAAREREEKLRADPPVSPVPPGYVPPQGTQVPPGYAPPPAAHVPPGYVPPTHADGTEPRDRAP